MRKMKNKKQERHTNGRKNEEKKDKRAQRGTYHPRWAPKLIFHIRTVKRNRDEKYVLHVVSVPRCGRRSMISVAIFAQEFAS